MNSKFLFYQDLEVRYTLLASEVRQFIGKVLSDFCSIQPCIGLPCFHPFSGVHARKRE